MAKPKKEYDIDVRENARIMFVHCDDIKDRAREIGAIEGVTRAHDNHIGAIEVYTDPRYDIHNIEKDVKDLLGARIPDTFLDPDFLADLK